MTRLTEQLARQPGERDGAQSAIRGRAGSSRPSPSCRSRCARPGATSSARWARARGAWGTSSRARSRGSLGARCAPKARSSPPWPGSSGPSAQRAVDPAAGRGRVPRSPARPSEQHSPAEERDLERRRTALAARAARAPRAGARARPLAVGQHHRPHAGRAPPPRAAVRRPDRHTRYPELEVVVVDNASTDGTLAYLEALQTPFPVHVLATGENLSFARGQRPRGGARRTASCCCS